MYKLKFDNLEKLKEIILSNGVIAFPTETVFGLGVRFDSLEAYDKLVKVKERPENKPFTMMLGNVESIPSYAYINDKQKKIIDEFMPGEITVILKKKEIIPDYVTHGDNTIGIRVPLFLKLQKMLNYINVPLLVPSCNKSGMIPCRNYQEVIEVFNNGIDGVVCEEAMNSLPSTVVDLTSEFPKVLRKGKISEEEILYIWNKGE